MYDVWVEIVDILGKPVESSEKISIDVCGKNKNITTFNQWKGVIPQGYDVGFSLTHDFGGGGKADWFWGDGTFTKNDTNPHHVYMTPGTWSGKVTVQAHNQGEETKDFGVMVLQTRKIFVGDFKVLYHHSLENEKHLEDVMPFPPLEQLYFEAKVDSDDHPFEYEWNIQLKDTQVKKDKLSFRYKFEKSGIYPVNLTITDKNKKKFIMSKEIIVGHSNIHS